MPFIEVVTNVDALPVDLCEQLIGTAADELGKSVQVFAGVATVSGLHFKASDEPAAVLRVSTLPIDDELASPLAAALTAKASALLDIDAGRVWVLIEDLPLTRWAVAGTLMSDR